MNNKKTDSQLSNERQKQSKAKGYEGCEDLYEPIVPPERPNYKPDPEIEHLDRICKLSQQAGNERRMFGKNHTMAMYNYFRSVKDRYRARQEEKQGDLDRLDQMNLKDSNFSGINNFKKQMEDSEYVDLQKYYDSKIKVVTNQE